MAHPSPHDPPVLGARTTRSAPAVADLTASIRLDAEIDALRTLGALWQGPGDPQMRFEGSTVLRATRTRAGPASMRLSVRRGEVFVEAWGAGAEAAVARAPDLLGASDDPSLLEPGQPLLQELGRRFAGLRLTRSGAVYETLIPTIIAQKVTGLEARRSYRALLHSLGEPAPGPLGLRLPPSPEQLARQPYHAFHALGIERRRAETMIAVGRVAERLERAVDMPLSEARRVFLAVPGVGPWSAAETARLALGDPDAVSVGDYGVPHLVCWALAGEPRGDDARMLELLEPYRGQRARVVRLLELGGVRPPRYGPRLPPRAIRSI